MRTRRFETWVCALGVALAGATSACQAEDDDDGDAVAGESGEAGGGGGGEAEAPLLCDTNREDWCLCGGEVTWHEEVAVDACTGYDCCYSFVRDGSSQRECACTNTTGCDDIVARIGGTRVTECPNGTAVAPSGGGGGGGSGSGDACRRCTSACRGIPGCSCCHECGTGCFYP